MIAGFDTDQSMMNAGCLNEGSSCTSGDCYTESTFFPPNSCEELEVEMRFPSCWNGELNPSDPTSHVAYKVNGVCPSTHRAGEFPEIEFFFRIVPYEGGWYSFSDGSDVFHADFMNGWKPGTLQNILNNCNTEGGSDEFCKSIISFNAGPKEESGLDDDRAWALRLRQFMPSEIDVSSISNEATDNVQVLPRGPGPCLNSPVPPTTPAPVPPTPTMNPVAPVPSPVADPTEEPTPAPTDGDDDEEPEDDDEEGTEDDDEEETEGSGEGEGMIGGIIAAVLGCML